MRTRLSIIAAAFLALLPIFMLHKTQSSGRTLQSSPKRISILNKTRALEITRAEVIGNQIHISVRNGYKKNVNWFRISLGKTSSIEADFVFTDSGVLAPTEIYEDVYPIDPDSDPISVTVVAVVFEDKTDDGDERFSAFIREKRQGQRLGLKRLLPLLEKSISSTGDNMDSVLESLEVEVSKEPTEEIALSEPQQIGLRNVKERLLNEVQRLKFEHGNDKRLDLRENLRYIKNQYSRIQAKLD